MAGITLFDQLTYLNFLKDVVELTSYIYIYIYIYIYTIRCTNQIKNNTLILMWVIYQLSTCAALPHGDSISMEPVAEPKIYFNKGGIKIIKYNDK